MKIEIEVLETSMHPATLEFFGRVRGGSGKAYEVSHVRVGDSDEISPVIEIDGKQYMVSMQEILRQMVMSVEAARARKNV